MAAHASCETTVDVEAQQHGTGGDGSRRPSPSTSACTLEYLTADIRDDLFAECELILLTIATGMQDATTFPDYHCFASNQTGNTVLLAISIAGLDNEGSLFEPANIGVALACFLGAGWVVGQLGHIIGARERVWLVATQLLQTALVLVAATLQYTYGVSETSPSDLAVIALLATAAGAQVVLSRALNMTEISTAMATAAWVDLLVDPLIIARHNRKRNRRVAFLAALVAGALIGAFALKYDSSALAVLLSGIVKAVVTLMFLFNRAAPSGKSVSDEKDRPLQCGSSRNEGAK